MRVHIKFLIYTLILFSITVVPVMAKEGKPVGIVQQQISNEEIPKGILFTIQSELKLSKGKIVIPKDSTVFAYVIDAQGERRWHKSGFIICKIKGYIPAYAYDKEEQIDIEKEEIYLVARKYEAIDKKEMTKTAAELTATTAASFIVPGVDIVYYFTKGVIKKKEGQTRFKSGVTTAYENSIFWFWLKGKPVDMEEDTSISFKEITESEAEKLRKKIEKRNEKKEKMQERKQSFKEFMS